MPSEPEGSDRADDDGDAAGAAHSRDSSGNSSDEDAESSPSAEGDDLDDDLFDGMDTPGYQIGVQLEPVESPEQVDASAAAEPEASTLASPEGTPSPEPEAHPSSSGDREEASPAPAIASPVVAPPPRSENATTQVAAGGGACNIPGDLHGGLRGGGEGEDDPRCIAGAGDQLGAVADQPAEARCGSDAEQEGVVEPHAPAEPHEEEKAAPPGGRAEGHGPQVERADGGAPAAPSRPIRPAQSGTAHGDGSTPVVLNPLRYVGIKTNVVVAPQHREGFREPAAAVARPDPLGLHTTSPSPPSPRCISSTDPSFPSSALESPVPEGPEGPPSPSPAAEPQPEDRQASGEAPPSPTSAEVATPPPNAGACPLPSDDAAPECLPEPPAPACEPMDSDESRSGTEDSGSLACLPSHLEEPQETVFPVEPGKMIVGEGSSRSLEVLKLQALSPGLKPDSEEAAGEAAGQSRPDPLIKLPAPKKESPLLPPARTKNRRKGGEVCRGLEADALSSPTKEETGPVNPVTKIQKSEEDPAGLLSCEEALDDAKPTPSEEPSKPPASKVKPKMGIRNMELTSSEDEEDGSAPPPPSRGGRGGRKRGGFRGFRGRAAESPGHATLQECSLDDADLDGTRGLGLSSPQRGKKPGRGGRGRGGRRGGRGNGAKQRWDKYRSEKAAALAAGKPWPPPPPPPVQALPYAGDEVGLATAGSRGSADGGSSLASLKDPPDCMAGRTAGATRTGRRIQPPRWAAEDREDTPEKAERPPGPSGRAAVKPMQRSSEPGTLPALPLVMHGFSELLKLVPSPASLLEAPLGSLTPCTPVRSPVALMQVSEKSIAELPMKTASSLLHHLGCSAPLSPPGEGGPQGLSPPGSLPREVKPCPIPLFVPSPQTQTSPALGLFCRPAKGSGSSEVTKLDMPGWQARPLD
eukprot:jgi/Botrbrau1/423/Bobra.110_2s0073.1